MQIGNWVIRGAAIATIALMGSAASQTAEARTTPGSYGITGPSQRHCLFPFNGTMWNYYCSEVVSLDVPLIVDSGGWHNITVTASGAGTANNVGCRGEGTNQTATQMWFSNGGNYTYLSSFGAAVDLPLNSVYVPGWGQLLVNCQVNPRGSVHTFNWNP